MILWQIHQDSHERTAQPNWLGQQLHHPKQVGHLSLPIRTLNTISLLINSFWKDIEAHKLHVYLHCIHLRLASWTYRDGCHEQLLRDIVYIRHLKQHSHRVLATSVELLHRPNFMNENVSLDLFQFVDILSQIYKSSNDRTLKRPHPVTRSFVPALTNLLEYLMGWTFSLYSISPSIKIKPTSLAKDGWL